MSEVQKLFMAGTEKGMEVNQLVKYEAAKFALSECVRVDEVKDIRDKSAAIAAAARIAKDKQLEIDASEIRIRAERRLGQMLAEQKAGEGLNKGAKAGRLPNGGTRQEPPLRDDKPTLAEIGIPKKLSSRSQALAAIPEDEFEETLEEHRQQQQAVTVATMQKLADKSKEAITDPLSGKVNAPDINADDEKNADPPNLAGLKRYWNYANKKERKAFLQYIKEEGKA
jgi:hypothetical protein